MKDKIISKIVQNRVTGFSVFNSVTYYINDIFIISVENQAAEYMISSLLAYYKYNKKAKCNYFTKKYAIQKNLLEAYIHLKENSINKIYYISTPRHYYDYDINLLQKKLNEANLVFYLVYPEYNWPYKDEIIKKLMAREIIEVYPFIETENDSIFPKHREEINKQYISLIEHYKSNDTSLVLVYSTPPNLFNYIEKLSGNAHLPYIKELDETINKRKYRIISLDLGSLNDSKEVNKIAEVLEETELSTREHI